MRFLQDVFDCGKVVEVFNTTYNSEEKNVPFKGIMFEVFAKGDSLDILGLELDVLANATDLSIEVFTKRGSFDNFLGSPDAWTQVAKTVAIPSPEGAGAIVPVKDFVPVSMDAREIRSFYIHMNEQVIDNRVNALEKTGELPDIMRGDDIDVFVGAGFDNINKFPGAETTLSVDPQFAGVVYYRKPNAQCTEETLITTVSYQYLFNTEIEGPRLLKLDETMRQAFENFLDKDDTLKLFQEENNLRLSGNAVSAAMDYDGKCRRN